MIKLRNLHPSLRGLIEGSAVGVSLSPNANLIYVDSGHAATGDGKPGSEPGNPLATIDAAFTASDTAVSASNGDIVVVMPGHTEDIDNATDLAPDVVGVTILGLGRGSDRPTLTFTDAASNIPISAANIVMSNFLITISGTTNVTAGITVTAADVAIKGIEARDSANNQWVDLIVLGAGSDRAHVDGLRHINVVDTASQTAISIVGGVVDGVVLENLDIDGGFTTAALENITNIATNLTIRNSRLRQRHATTDAVIDVVATTTGWIDGVRIRVATDDFAGFSGVLVDTDAMQIYDTLVVNADGQQGSPPVSVFSSANLFAVDTSLWNVVTKVGALDTTTDALFTVTGKVLVMSFTGIVTNAVNAGSNDIIIRVTTTNIELGGTTIIDGDIIGTKYRVTGQPGDTLLTGVMVPFTLDGVTVEHFMSGGGTPDAGDAIEWTVCYVPLEAAANVVSA